MLAFPLIQVHGQTYIEDCSQIKLRVQKPEVPENPECYSVEVEIFFAPVEDTLPKLFYASPFTLSGTITNGVITGITHNFSSYTSNADDDDSFDVFFGNTNNAIDTESRLTVTIETEPGAEFLLNVSASDFTLQDNGSDPIGSCNDFTIGTESGVVYQANPSCSCIPPMLGASPYACNSPSTPGLDPGLEFFVDVENAIYDEQTAELPIKIRNVRALDTITLIRADYKLEMDDVYNNLTITDSENENDFLITYQGNVVSGKLLTPKIFILDSLESESVGSITLEAPSYPITAGEAIFDFLYARVLVEDINGYVGLDHCCKPPGIGDTLQIGDVFPCQIAGTPLVLFSDLQYEDEGMVIPVYIENFTHPSNDILLDTFVLELEITTTGDLELDSLAMLNSLAALPSCPSTSLSFEVDSITNKVRIELAGFCELDYDDGDLFDLIINGTGGCIQGVKATVLKYSYGINPTCVPVISEDFPTGCWKSKGEILMWCGSNIPIPDVTICLDTLAALDPLNCQQDPLLSECEQTETTDNQGSYTIEVDTPKRFSLTPIKTDDIRCGVSTFDLIKIRQHILTTEPFDAPEKLIAGDVDTSGAVTTFDLITIQKFILVPLFELPKYHWRFVPVTHTFDPLPTFPTGYDECFLYPENTNFNFKAIKMGDVDCSCGNLSNFQDTIEVSVNEVIISGGRKLEFESSEFDTIVAFQFGFDFDSDNWVYQEEIEEDLPFFTADAIGASSATDGNLKIAWYDTTTIGRTLGTSEKMLSLEFEDEPWVSGGSILTELALNETDIQAVAYKGDGTPLVIRLVKDTGHRLPYPAGHDEEQENAILVAVQPNPSKGEVVFSIKTKEALSANLFIFDIQGKQMASIPLDLIKGKNMHQLEDMQSWPTGMYWYRLESEKESLSGKIIKE